MHNKKSEKKINVGFTLVELIIVIIIVGIMAAIGLTQYSAVVEKSRLAEAKTRIGLMRKLTYAYYNENGSLNGITNNDVGVDGACTSASFYRFFVSNVTPTWLFLAAERCISGGKTPNAPAIYYYYTVYEANTDVLTWYCVNQNDSSPCYGLPIGDIMG